jgi:HTH-type transcriptional regulator / antitoxin HigA
MKNLAEPITPIRDQAAHRAALAEIERLWGAKSNTPEGDRLDVLMALVDDYERTNWPDEALDPIDAIHARMETSGRTRKDFEKIVGSSGRASEILSRKRHLTLPMIWRLVEEWRMPAEVLVRPYKLVPPETSSKRKIGRSHAIS